MAKDDLLYANPANYVVDVIGEGHPASDLGAYHQNPWRQLTVAEFTALEHRFPCMKAMNAAPHKLVNGAYQTIFSCDGYTIMRQNVSNMTYWYVYNHPGPLVFAMKQSESTPAVPSRSTTTMTPSRTPYALRGVPHWLGVGEPDLGEPDLGRSDLGAYVALPNPQNRPEISAAIDFLAYYDANGCSKQSLPVVVAFQNAYNASGLPGQLTVDGEYGPNTQRAVQNTMDEAQADAGAGPSQQAPANCFPEYGNVPSIPALDRPNATPSGGGTYTAPVTTVTPSAPAKSNAAILLIGGAAAAVAAGGGYLYWKRHRRGR